MSYQRGNPRRDRDREMRSEPESEFAEEVIHINRVAKVVKGGRKFHFTALVAVGDKESRVGLGYGKALEVVDAIKKGVDEAKRNMVTVYRDGSTIPYEVKSDYCASTVLLRPAAKGHGVIAGGVARPILTLAGIEDVTAKFLGSNNHVNCARATFEGLKSIATPDYIKRLRSGQKLNRQGKFDIEEKKDLAKQAIEEFTAEEEAEKRKTEERLSRPKDEDKADKPAGEMKPVEDATSNTDPVEPAEGGKE